jgi:hypothetical protein
LTTTLPLAKKSKPTHPEPTSSKNPVFKEENLQNVFEKSTNLGLDTKSVPKEKLKLYYVALNKEGPLKCDLGEKLGNAAHFGLVLME